MQNFMRKAADQKGFTLVELMIVVAIIGILAAIAIPQFAAYRMRAFNSSAVSDVKNLSTTEQVFFNDNSMYGVSNTGAALAALAQAGGLLTGPGTAATTINQFVNAADRSLAIPLGNGVSIVANCDPTAQTFLGVSKHMSGSNYYGVESDTTATYVATGTGNLNAGVTLAVADAPASTTAATDLTAAAAINANTAQFVGM